MANRTRRCEIRFTENEYRNLMKKAEEAGISISELVRKSLTNCEVKAAPPSDLYKLIWEIRRIGNCIYEVQINSEIKDLLDISQLHKAMNDLREVEVMIADTYSQVPVPKHKK